MSARSLDIAYPEYDDRLVGRRRAPRASASRRAVWATVAAVTTGTMAVSGVALASSPSTDTPPAPEPAQPAPIKATPEQQHAPGTVTPGATQLGLVSSPTPVNPNAPTVVKVSLYAPQGGASVAGQRVRILRADGFRWQTAAVVRTDSRGTAQVTARMLTTTRLIAVFDGGETLWPTSSNDATVQVVAPKPKPKPVVAPAPVTSTATTAPAGGGPTQADDSTPTTPVASSAVGAQAVALAAAEAGKPYVWGAEGPDSFDCSGLVQYVFGQLGRDLPRTADDQFYATKSVSADAKEPGDLLFYGSPGSIYHVAIYAGDGMMWEAPQSGETVHKSAVRSGYLATRVL